MSRIEEEDNKYDVTKHIHLDYGSSTEDGIIRLVRLFEKVLLQHRNIPLSQRWRINNETSG